MADGRRGQEKKTIGFPRPSPNPPRLSPYKRICTSSSSAATTSSSSSSLHLLKKTRYAPDLFRCHSCGLRFPSNNSNPLDNLCSLRSQWRVALLCRDCLARVRSAGLCSYCFSPVSNVAAAAYVSCLRCSCRVHLGCVDREHRRLTTSRLEPGSFTCVDCCAIPKCWRRSPEIGSGVSLEEVMKEASSVAEKKAGVAARARENAVEKAAAAKRAADRARNALGAVLVATEETPKQNGGLAQVPDEELALMLHLSMNGSRRISRNLVSLSSGGSSTGLKKARHSSCDLIGGCRIDKTVGICAEGKISNDRMERMVFGPTADVNSHSIRNDHKRLIDENDKNSSADIPLKEDCGSCSDKVSSHGESTTSECERNNESDGELLPSICQAGAIEESSEIPGRNDIVNGDRYFNKYSKRKSRPNDLMDSKIVPQLPISCSEVSRMLVDCPYQASSAAVHSSVHTNGLSHCES
ncbi:hypothetical protein Cni_G20646 [Canna indica]|uniref:Uncharacterized protein n=1 Tax=Canna indica TaxID=4628 RepID=A0AAQ3KUA9_9LILI|nr:hypothetical protein Cni_G20646 [Canna indica]